MDAGIAAERGTYQATLRRTYQATVAVLEDHDDTIDSICEVLRRDGKQVKVANNLKKFEQLIKDEGTFDVCSIDWKINDIAVGSTALSRIRQYERDAGKLVYSVYPVEKQARDGGADAVLRKKMQNYNEYCNEVESLARVGLSRQIARRLNKLGFGLQVSPIPSPQEEEALFRQSRLLVKEIVTGKTPALAGKAAVAGGKTDVLIDLIKRRGWWGVFDTKSYSNLPIWEKLTTLLQYVEANAEDIAQILQCSLAESRAIVNERKISTAHEDSADELLSILAYVLRLSKDEPLIMIHYWKASNLFAGSLSAPPWDAAGLYDYLKTSGVSGIEDALSWIRSH